jgi:DNA replication protein DnaC
LFETRIPFPREKKWKHVKFLFFALNEKKEVFKASDSPFCCDCQPYILGPGTDFSIWWEKMTANLSPMKSQSPSTTLNRDIYKQAIQVLTHQMYIQQDCITNQDLLNYTENKIEKISTPDKLFFWSKAQYPLFNDSRNKRMVYISPFGTGKTTLLKAMARKLLERGEKVILIFWENESLLQKAYHEDFKIFKDQIQILLLKCKGNQLNGTCFIS